jgi:competence protein ComEC
MSSSPMMDRRPPFAVPTGDFQFCAARATASHSPKERLAADADARTPKDVSLNKGVTCDAIGCIGKLTDGRLASMVLEIEAFAEDCARAAVVVSAREAPSSACASTLVDRDVWRALHRSGGA